MEEKKLTVEQEKILRHLKAHFPYRVVFGVLDKDSGEFSSWAKSTKREALKLARQGHAVFILS